MVLADVSGSMERYSQVLLSFVYGLAHSAARVEAFLFATQLTRVTRPLIDHRGAAVFTRVARDVQDWGGGTRIGEALRTFNLRWARRVIRNGPIVLIVSDGWDRGDPALLGRELARIRRSCRRADLAQPAPRVGGIRAADARHAGGVAARRRLPAGAESRQPRAAREPPASAAGAVEAGGMEAGWTRILASDRRTTMNLEATYTFDATVERTWALLMDTEAIAACLPGCRGLRPAGDNRYEVDLGVAIAAISGDFKGTVALLDLVPPQSYTLAVEGTGRPGFVKGQARVTLEAAGERTLVKIAAQADVGGTIARLGQRLVEGVARTTMDRFYACLARTGSHVSK